MPLGMNEKRRYARIHSKIPFHWKICGEAKEAYATIEDLGLGGINFIHDRFIPPRTHLMLEFKLLQKAFSAIGKVAWTSNMAHTHTYRSGVEFLEIEQLSKNCLEGFCALKASV